MAENEDGRRFEQSIVPHLGTAYNLARWLTKSAQDADEVLQESSIKACRFIKDLKSEDARSWFLQIVRTTSYTWLKRKRNYEVLNERLDLEDQTPNAEALLLSSVNSEMIHAALGQLPPEYREVLILRELEELSYEQISKISDLPIGTVMSRLSRARSQLRAKLSHLKGRN